MTAWRVPIVRQAEITDTAERNHGPAHQPDTARPRSLSGAIKQLFQEVKRALTGKAPAPTRKAKRRRSGETQGGFRVAFKQIFGRVRRSIYHPANFSYEAPDEMDESQRLHLWHQNNQEGECWHENEAFHQESHDHLSLHL